MDYLSLRKVTGTVISTRRLTNNEGNPRYRFEVSVDGAYPQLFTTSPKSMAAFNGPPPEGEKVTMVVDRFGQIANYGWAECPLRGFGEDLR